MRTKPPYNIWVYHRADGVTTFGEYIRAKRRVFLSGKLDDTTATRLQQIINDFHSRGEPRKLAFAGDTLPPAFLAKVVLNPTDGTQPGKLA